MNNRRTFLDEMPGGFQLIIEFIFLFSLMGVFALIFTYASFILVKPLYGVVGVDTLLTQMSNHPGDFKNDMVKINAVKFIQLMSSIGAFLVPALIFPLIKGSPVKYLRISQASKPVMYLLGILIILVSAPLIDYTSVLNQGLRFPDSMKFIYDAIKSSEDKAASLTHVFLIMPHVGDFIYNLVLIAILPAMVEEFLFRGCIQQILNEKIKNIHVAVWISAFIFSFMHFEFFGFLPRMILGGLLGYLFYYSGSIWVNTLAHAFNNGSQVVAIYLFQKGLISTNMEGDSSMPVLYVISSLPILALLIYFLYRSRVRENISSGDIVNVNEPPPPLV